MKDNKKMNMFRRKDENDIVMLGICGYMTFQPFWLKNEKIVISYDLIKIGKSAEGSIGR